MGFLASQLERLATKSSIFRGAVTRASRPIKAIDTGVGHFADAYRRTRGSDGWRISSQMVKGFGQELTSRGSLGAMAIAGGATGAAGYYTGTGTKEDRLKRASSFAAAGAGLVAGYKLFRSPAIRAGMQKLGPMARQEFNSIRGILSGRTGGAASAPVAAATAATAARKVPQSLPKILNNVKPNIPTPTANPYANAAEAREYLQRLHRPMTTERYGAGYSAFKNRAANMQQYNDMFVSTAGPVRPK